MSTVLQRALNDPVLPELPAEAAELLLRLQAPPRLVAHLRAVHDVAAQIAGWLRTRHTGLVFDLEAVLFGAATHDIGKIIHVEELSGPGSLHEPAGLKLLLENGIEARLARFAGTRGRWQAPGIEVEDLIVSLADKVWKAKRVPDLEQLVVGRLGAASGEEPWQVFLDLDDRLDSLAAGADQRLEFQNSCPIRS